MENKVALLKNPKSSKFSYFGNGMNFTDILHLKWGNITDDTISFQRQNTFLFCRISKTGDQHVSHTVILTFMVSELWLD